MGDRRNVVVRFSDENSVALYTHWTGSALPNILAEALKRGISRWTDAEYLTRIIFCEMVQGNVRGDTGYGIAPFKTGTSDYCEATPGYDLLVDPEKQTVSTDKGTLSFSKYVTGYKKIT